MTFTLHDYMGYPHELELPEGTTKVIGIIISGDEILIYPVYCDPMWSMRDGDALDGSFCRVYEDGEWKDVEIPDGKEVEL